jgi:hypothetical protein
MVAAGVSCAGADNHPALFSEAECKKERFFRHYAVAGGIPHDGGVQTMGKASK